MNHSKSDSQEIKIISILRSLQLNPMLKRDNPDQWIADCPSDVSHEVSVDISSNSWSCGSCGIGGSLLELDYYKCLSDEQILREKILKSLDQLNLPKNMNYSLSTLPDSTQTTDWDPDQKELFDKIQVLSSQYKSLLLPRLDQLRLSMMQQTLNEGEELNDDLSRWWADRY